MISFISLSLTLFLSLLISFVHYVLSHIPFLAFIGTTKYLSLLVVYLRSYVVLKRSIQFYFCVTMGMAKSSKSMCSGRNITASFSYITERGEGKMERARGSKMAKNLSEHVQCN
jgi:hypothetical protein